MRIGRQSSMNSIGMGVCCRCLIEKELMMPSDKWKKPHFCRLSIFPRT